MVNGPTLSEFVVLDVSLPDNQSLIELYKVNKKLCTTVGLGQGKSHGMGLLSKTKSDDYLNGLAWKFMEKVKKANKPCCN
jgi:hypothetical protein